MLKQITLFDWFLIAAAMAWVLVNAFVVPPPRKELNESHPHNANYEVRHGSG